MPDVYVRDMNMSFSANISEMFGCAALLERDAESKVVEDVLKSAELRRHLQIILPYKLRSS
jgi:hypothetical protein